MNALSTHQSQTLDRLAAAEFGISGLVLMENAGREIAAIAEQFPGTIAVVCGPGNNGGDGFVCARHLANHGRNVRIHLIPPESNFTSRSDAGINLSIVLKMGFEMHKTTDISDAGMVIDALFGTGLTRTVEGPYRAAIEAINRYDGPVISVDVPSGLDADTGEPHGTAVRASLTATMVAPKIGLETGQGPTFAGDVHIVDIGVPLELIERARRAPD